MLKKIRKNICFLLVVVMLIPVLTGCLSSSDEDDIPEIVPELQIFADEYERNAEITELMTYTTTYVTPNNNSLFNSMKMINLFNHFQVQVDNWSCITVGKTTMGEIVKIVDGVNKKYVEDNTNAIIAERQAEIDSEYDKAVKKAEEKGKVYDKPKKAVRTDDIHFDEPYTYTVTFGTNSKAAQLEYQETLLVDPDTYQIIFLDVAKYGIPYVRFEFKSVGSLYNTRITQESDWIVNGIKAADVSSYGLSADGKTPLEEKPNFIDSDGLNKAAKQNIYMSGDIAFGGKGFDWNSLMLLCNALDLIEDENKGGFSQSSDQKFTYYTITLYTNIFELYPEYKETHSKIVIPCTRLIATFDPLSQVCLNWTIDSYTTTQSFTNQVYEMAVPTNVNIHEYQVDTNDYAGMRESIKSWIKTNAIQTTTSYCALNRDKNDELFGIVEGGMINATIEITIDGTLYSCRGYSTNPDGSLLGTYIAAEELQAAELMSPHEAAKHIEKHSKNLLIACYVLDNNDKILGKVVEDIPRLMQTDNKTYHIADYELTEIGYRNVRIMEDATVDRLINIYTVTYKLTEEQHIELQNIFRNDGVMAMQDYIDELFADAEEAQKGNGFATPDEAINFNA